MPKKRTPLTRELVLEAALKILDEQGIVGLSMRKIASALHVEAMSLYNHVENKNDLLNGVVDLVLSRIELPDAALPWRDRLEVSAMKIYEAFIQHPALVIVISSEQGTPNVMQGVDSIIAALEDAGLPPQQQVNAFRGLLAMCFGFILTHTQGFSTTKEMAQQEWDQIDTNKWEANTVPHLAKLAPYFLQTSADDDFQFMLHAYLDSIQKSQGS
ncbi:MAG: TetR/AcrR family transcriptional regulator C-terminal domain-containing protein [Candidatus Promineifilaceae bacterium]|nr:TetR/AcrR family transcriptional regulator C-terminal domain-containing protein [Anaerolineaceae bacterium]